MKPLRKVQVSVGKEFGAATMVTAGMNFEPIQNIGLAQLAEHPFHATMPQPNKYVDKFSNVNFICDVAPGGPNSRARMQQFLRIIERQRVMADPFNPPCITYLRRIEVPYLRESSHMQYFYEIGVEENLYMVKAGDDFTESGIEIAEQMFKVFIYLSEVYEVTQKHFKVPIASSEKQQLKLSQVAALSSSALASELATWIAKQESPTNTFFRGNTVKWNLGDSEVLPPGITALYQIRDIPHPIKAIETIPAICTCGIGAQTPLRLHLPKVCSLKRIEELKHNQLLTIEVDRRDITLSGDYFKFA